MNSLPKTIRTIARERTEMPEQTPALRVQNFAEVALGYEVTHAVREAARCLDCADPPCLRGCPVAVDIPGFLRKVTEQDFRSAYDLLTRSNVLPAICGRVCPQEDQCEGVCTIGDVVEPVAIGRVERWLGDLGIAQGWSTPTAAMRNGFRVGIVGSGPAGIACAAELAKLGCEVTLFDALHAPGGVLRYGIPEFRLPNRVVDAEVHKLALLGVKLACNTLVGRLFTIAQMIDELGFHAVFIATGAGLPKFMHIPGEELNGVVSANELLTRCNLMHAGRLPDSDTPLGLGRRVAVIGAGNTAMDALRVARRAGAEQVLCVYRRSRTECPARAEELHHAEQEGITFHWLTSPLEIVGDDAGNVRALRCERMQLGEPDASGRRRPEPVPDSTLELEVDMVVYAIGTSANPIIGQTSPIALNRQGYIETDPSLATSLAGVYAGGDIVTGSATVILAMGAGRRAARSIAAYLGIAEPEPPCSPSVFGVDAGRHVFVRMRAGDASTTPARATALYPAALRPVLEIGRLRHRYPLLLASALTETDAPVRSLRACVDRLIDAQGREPDEGFAHAAHMLEAELRSLTCDAPQGGDAALPTLAHEAARRLLERAPAEARASLERRLDALRGALPPGTLVPCSSEGIERTVELLWRRHHARHMDAMHAELAALDRTLTALERSDFMTTEAAWSASQLAASIGASEREDFDFEALSQLLVRARASDPGDSPRSARIRTLQSALADENLLRLQPSAWVFRSVSAAAMALEERAAELGRVLRAVADAQLDTRDEVAEPSPASTETSPTEVRKLLPPSLLMLDLDRLASSEQTLLFELLASDLPVTVLGRSASLDGAFPGGRAALLAALACGLGSVHVVQTALSELPDCTDRLTRAVEAPGPSLIAVYTGEGHPSLPAYLAAAAARAARFFPSFTFDPIDMQLALDDDPAPDAAWPSAAFHSEDAALQRVVNDEAFTPAHLLASSSALTAYAIPVPSASWGGHLVPVAQFLEAGASHPTGSVPYVSMVDREGRLYRVVVSGPILAQTRSVAARYRGLCRMAAARRPVEVAHAADSDAPADTPVVAQTRAAAKTTQPDIVPRTSAPEAARSGPFIETARCSSCDECVRRSPRMFAYDDDRRAVLSDVRAGSYHELVAAAEHCKMAIIHPGEPWDETEPDLDALRQRAAVFC